MAVPCAGWVHPSMLERAVKRGAAGVVVLGCQSDPDFRLGSQWLDERIEGERHPRLKSKKMKRNQVLYLKMNRSEMNEFVLASLDFKESSLKYETLYQENYDFKTKTIARWKKGLFSFYIFAIVSLLTYIFSIAPISLPEKEAEIRLFFKMKGNPIETEVRDDANLLPHMKSPTRDIIEKRANIRLQLLLNGKIIKDEVYEPKGIRKRGYRNALINIPIEPGFHRITINLGDASSTTKNNKEQEWIRYTDNRNIEIQRGNFLVILFEESHFFRWYIDE